MTLYPSELMTLSTGMYTKHYYNGSARIASRIGGGFVPHRDLNDYSPVATADRVPLLQTSSYDHKADNLRNLWARAGECMGVSLEYAYSLESSGLYLNPTETADGERYFYHSDHLGSSAFITTENGYATQFLAYMPFGETLSEQQNSTSYYSPFKFSAKEKDTETGYSYFGARYYSPELSMWLSIDPMADKRPWLSAYNYCQLNPVMRLDPTGMIDIMIEDFSGGGEGNENGDPPAKTSLPKNAPAAPAQVDNATSNQYNGNRPILGHNVTTASPSPLNAGGNTSYSGKALSIGGTTFDALNQIMRPGDLWLGKNGKYYNNNWGGNRYTGSRSGAFLGAQTYRWAGVATVGVTGAFGIVETYQGYRLDGNTFGYNAQSAFFSTTGGLFGGWLGAKAGASIGLAAGAWFPPLGWIIGPVVGTVIFGAGGGYVGSEISKEAVNLYHGR